MSEGKFRIGRRKLLAGAAVGAAGVALGACSAPPTSSTAPKDSTPASSQAPAAQTGGKTFTWKMQSTWTAGDFHQNNPKNVVERVNRMAAGRLKIELLPTGAVVPAAEVLDAVHKGIIDAGNGWPGYWYGKHPAATLWASIPGGPYGMNSEDFMSWVYLGGGKEMYNELLQKEMKLDVVAFPSYGETPEPLGWFKTPIKTVADFKGLKFRAGGMSAEVFKAMGMSVVTLASGEIVPALERGTVDAAEYSDPSSDMSNGFQDVRKFYQMPGIHQPTGMMEILVNRKKWDELPEDLKAMVEVACEADEALFVLQMLDRNSKDLLTLVNDKGVTVVQTEPAILKEVLDAWEKVAAQKSSENPFFKKVLESQKAWAKRIVPFRRVAHPDYNFAADYYWSKENPYKPIKA
ncbi:MAG: TRAP transporter substrate-binding protein [Chloroflexota bacterium]